MMVKIFGVYNSMVTSNTDKIIRDMFSSFGFGSLDYKIFKNYSIGHLKTPSLNRKGIIEDDDFIVSFSGNIFDYEKDFLELQKKYVFNNPAKEITEEKYILYAYKFHGKDFVKKLNGVFVIVIFDKKSQKLFIINDRYGLRPMYYYFDDNKIVFASEIKAIICDSKINREINWDFWKDFFSYGYALGNKAPLKNIFSLPNATILEYSKDGKIVMHKYWDYNLIEINHTRSEKETVSIGVNILKNVIQRQTSDLDECIVFLSGGYDSRVIAAGIKKYSNVKIKAYTIPKNNVGTNTLKDKDARYSIEVAKNLGITHKLVDAESKYFEKYLTKFIYEQEGLGFENMWMMPLIAQLDAKDVSLTNFDGIAGDVFLKAGNLIKPGVSYSSDLSNVKRIKTLKNEKLSLIIGEKLLGMSYVNVFSVMPFFKQDIRTLLTPNFKSVYNEVSLLNERLNYENNIKAFQVKNRTKNTVCLEPNNLIARKIYSRMPFCDNEFVEFALSIPIEMKVKKDIYKQILDESFPDLKSVPSTNDDIGIKAKLKRIIIKSNADFFRYAIGIFKNLKLRSKPVSYNRKLSENPKDVQFLIGLVDSMTLPEFIDKNLLTQTVHDHVVNDKDPSYFLEPIIHFCIWYDLFIERNKLIEN